LQSRIELAIGKQQLVTQEGSNERRRAQEASAAERIVVERRVERDRMQAAANADATRFVGVAEAEVARARAAVYDGTDPRVLVLLGIRELAPHLPQVGSITLSPDVLTGALATLTAAPQARS
jgi:regulator of protease activity HflC (stomatin/prohibitin superfamily)